MPNVCVLLCLQHCSTAALSSRCANFPSCNWICQPMLTRWQSPRNMDMMIMLSIDSRASYWQVSQWTTELQILFRIIWDNKTVIVTNGREWSVDNCDSWAHEAVWGTRAENNTNDDVLSCVGTQTWTRMMESVVSCQYKQCVQLWMN